MNVLVSSCFQWWNAEAAYAAVLAELLQAGGHGVWVLAPPGSYNSAHLRVRRLRVLSDIPIWENNPLTLRKAIASLRAFQAREGIRIVNVFRSREVLWHLLAARGRPGVRVVRTRGSAMPIRGNVFNRWLYRGGCAGLIASSDAARTAMQDTLGIAAERVRTIYYPVDLPGLPDGERRRLHRQALLDELGLPGDAFLLAIVGRAAPVKGHDRLLEAVARLVPRHPALALLILDKALDDPPAYTEQLRTLTGRLGLEDRVRWLGWREDVRQVMGAADIGVIPSVASEMNCRVAVEFMSMAVPVVAFPTGALPEVVEDGVSGRIAASHRPEHLADALAALMEDPPMRERMGRGARRQTEIRFSRERFLQQSLAAFEAVLAQR